MDNRGWLVLSRRQGEAITIGDEITVIISEVSPGGRVKVAIRAPRELQILRDDAKTRSGTP